MYQGISHNVLCFSDLLGTGLGIHHGDGSPDFATFAPAHEAEALGRGGLDGDGIDGDAHDAGEGFPHGEDVRGELGTLEGDGDVGVADAPALRGDEGYDLPQQDFAVDALPLGRGVGEQMADVPEGEGAEEGVAQGVDGHVAVRVGHEARFRRDADPAQPHGKPFREGVYVVSVSDSDIHGRKYNEK